MCILCLPCRLVKWLLGSALAIVIVLAIAAAVYFFAIAPAPAPSVYEHYTAGGVKEGLKANAEDFTLNQKVISLHSGSIHYFRVHPYYWRDRLRKLRAAGFVAVETYIPWNLHEPSKGVFDFGDGNEDMSPFLDIKSFLTIAKEEDLLAIIRPGPYICAEFEFGGLPSWLLRENNINIRTSDPNYIDLVQKYFDKLLPILRDLQFTTNQGPIIAFQIENEYGNTKEKDKNTTDLNYLKELKKMFEAAELKELFFTSDTPSKGAEFGAVEGVLETANFNEDATKELEILKSYQPDKAAMVMEFWTGWFDHWGENHHGMSLKDFKKVLEDILKFPSGVNFYMFHGGTSFGFLNGGNVYKTFPYFLPDISCYDYDAPLSEAGDYTEKYEATSEILAKYQKVKLRRPNRPDETKKIVYTPLDSPEFISWNNLLSQIEKADIEESLNPLYMEQLSLNNLSGQSYGYIVYRKERQILEANSTLQIVGKINGAAMVIVDNELQSPQLQTIDDFHGFGYWCSDNDQNMLKLRVKGHSISTVDIVIENWGRNNYGKLSSDFNQVRGLTSGQIKIDGKEVQSFKIYPLQFKGKWVKSLAGWQPVTEDIQGPVLLRFQLEISEPADTFLDMQGWGKGIVLINGFNIGRYSSIGPIRTLFVPSPLLNAGSNEIIVFEHFPPAHLSSMQLRFSKKLIFKDADKTFNVEL